MGLHQSEVLVVSSNAWHATKARHFGYPLCWVNRAGGAFEEPGQHPHHVASRLRTAATARTEVPRPQRGSTLARLSTCQPGQIHTSAIATLD